MSAHQQRVVSLLYFFWEWEKRAAENKGACASVVWENNRGFVQGFLIPFH